MATNRSQPGRDTRSPDGEVVRCFRNHLAAVRLISGTAEQAQQFSRTVGLSEDSQVAEPDVEVRLVQDLYCDGPPRFLDADAAFTDNGFFLVGRPDRAPIAQVAFAYGGPDTIWLCCPWQDLAIVNRLLHCALLGKRILPLHASAIQYQGKGIVLTGWPGVGKTGILLAFMEQGAAYIGDDAVCWNSKDGSISGWKRPIELRPEYVSRLTESSLKRTVARRLRDNVLGSVAASLRRSRRRTLQKVRSRIESLRRHSADPIDLFGAERCRIAAPLNTFILLGKHDGSDIAVRPLEASAALTRLEAVLHGEWEPILALRRKYRFAFPDQARDRLDRFEETHRVLLQEALHGKSVFEVWIPPAARIESVLSTLITQCGL